MIKGQIHQHRRDAAVFPGKLADKVTADLMLISQLIQLSVQPDPLLQRFGKILDIALGKVTGQVGLAVVSQMKVG
ncbi:MAG: hypothetical protein LPH21_01375 [Shewanella sp.]|nr:hypothetical protein [Shewanella sp.]